MKRTSLLLIVLTLFALTALLTSSAVFARSDQAIKELVDLNGLKRFHIELPASNKGWMGFVAETDDQGDMKVTTFDDPAVMADKLGVTIEEVLNKTTPKGVTRVSSSVVEKTSDNSLKDPFAESGIK